MKLAIDKGDLQRGLARLQAIVEKRSSMPILANVLATATGKGDSGKLELAATPGGVRSDAGRHREHPLVHKPTHRPPFHFLHDPDPR